MSTRHARARRGRSVVKIPCSRHSGISRLPLSLRSLRLLLLNLSFPSSLSPICEIRAICGQNRPACFVKIRAIRVYLPHPCFSVSIRGQNPAPFNAKTRHHGQKCVRLRVHFLTVNVHVSPVFWHNSLDANLLSLCPHLNDFAGCRPKIIVICHRRGTEFRRPIRPIKFIIC